MAHWSELTANQRKRVCDSLINDDDIAVIRLEFSDSNGIIRQVREFPVSSRGERIVLLCITIPNYIGELVQQNSAFASYTAAIKVRY